MAAGGEGGGDGAASLREWMKVSASSAVSSEHSAKKCIDGSEETCWMSKPGKDTSLEVVFRAPVDVSEDWLRFHGGFAATRVSISTPKIGADDWTEEGAFALVDGTSVQKVGIALRKVRKMRIGFVRTVDFYGRVALYTLDVRGVRSAPEP